MPRKGLWIRDHLLTMGEAGDYPYGMWTRWKHFIELAHKQDAMIPLGSYESMRHYLYVLGRAGLVTRAIEAGEPKTRPSLFPSRRDPETQLPTPTLRNYYTVVKEELKNPLWYNPISTQPSWQAARVRQFQPKKPPKAKKTFPPKKAEGA